MKRTALFLLFAALIMLAMAGLAIADDEGSKETTAAPEETGKSATASVSYMSQYVSRGQVLSRSGVIQPTIDLDYYGFDVNLWSNYDMARDVREVTETDLTVKYTHTFGPVTLGAGYSYLGVKDANTEEAFVSASYNTILTPTLTYYQDLRLGKGGGFMILGLSQQSPDLWHGITVGGCASGGFNFKNATMGGNQNVERFNGPYYGEVGANVNIPVTKAITIVPTIMYDFPLSKDASYALSDARRAVGDGGDSHVLWGGVTVSVGF